MDATPSHRRSDLLAPRTADTEVSAMRTRLSIRKGQDDGFTMIELFVIMIIIGILAGIAFPLLLRQRERAVHASLRSDLRNAATAMETYYLDVGLYPRSDGDLETPFTAEKNTVLMIVEAETTEESYCLMATNPGSGSAMYYDSDRGGVQPLGETCS